MVVDDKPYTEAKMKSLVLKDEFDVQDEDGRWAAGRVAEVRDEGILVTYVGFKASYNKVYSWEKHESFCPAWTKVYKGKKSKPKPAAGAKRKKKAGAAQKSNKKAKLDSRLSWFKIDEYKKLTRSGSR